MQFNRETAGSTDWGAEHQSVALHCSTGSVLQGGLMEQLSMGQETPEVALTALEAQPTSDPTNIWLVGGWEQEGLPPSGSKMQQRSGWIWITLRIP